MKTKIPEMARCLDCGYMLRGLPGTICPECGRAFDPADSSTFRQPLRASSWHAWARPPGKIHTAAVIVLTLLFIKSRSDVVAAIDGLTLEMCFLVPIVLAFVLVYPVYAVAYYFDRQRMLRNRGVARSRPGRWRWCVVPAGVALFFSTIPWNWALLARFSLSRGALESEARLLLRQANSGLPSPTGSRRKYIGFYCIDSAAVDAGNSRVHFFTTDESFDPVGFVYAPNGCPSHARDVGLPAGWYAFED